MKNDLSEYHIRNTKFKIKDSLRWALAFIGCIIAGVGLWIQTIEQWNMNPLVVLFVSIVTVIFIILGVYSLHRSVGSEIKIIVIKEKRK